VSPPGNINAAPLTDVWMSVPLGRPRLPTPEPTTSSGYDVPPTRLQQYSNTPSPRPLAPRFPPPQVFYDPSLSTTPSPLPRFPPPQVYHDPSILSNPIHQSNYSANQEKPQFPPPQVYQGQQGTTYQVPAFTGQQIQTISNPPAGVNVRRGNQNYSPYGQPISQLSAPSHSNQPGTPSVHSESSEWGTNSRADTLVSESSAKTMASKRSKLLSRFSGRK